MPPFINMLLISAATKSYHPAVHAELDRVMLLGFLSTFLAFAFWVNLNQARAFRLMFSVSLLALAAYGFLAGAWPLGLVNIVAAGAQFHKWFIHSSRQARKARSLPRGAEQHGSFTHSEERIVRLFGSHSSDPEGNSASTWKSDDDDRDRSEPQANRN